jgi:hypothetical protein
VRAVPAPPLLRRGAPPGAARTTAPPGRAAEAPREVIVAAPAVRGREGAGPSGAGAVGIGSWPTTTGVLVEGTLTDGTLVEGTLADGTVVEGTLTPGRLTPGTLTPARLTPGTLTPGTPTLGTTEGTASVDGAPGTDTAPATALTEAPSVAPQRPAASAFIVVCRRLRRCAGMFSHRTLPPDPPPAIAPWPEPYSLLVASTVAVRLVKKDAFCAPGRRGRLLGRARRRRLACVIFRRVGGASCSPISRTGRKGDVKRGSGRRRPPVRGTCSH